LISPPLVEALDELPEEPAAPEEQVIKSVYSIVSAETAPSALRYTYWSNLLHSLLLAEELLPLAALADDPPKRRPLLSDEELEELEVCGERIARAESYVASRGIGAGRATATAAMERRTVVKRMLAICL